MWRDKLKNVIQEKKMYGEKINTGASEADIELFIKEVKRELNYDLPSDYIIILKEINGIEFNGFILYGIDQQLLFEKQNQNINGLIECNKIWYENQWQDTYIFLGESNISWYVYSFNSKKYFELDNPSGTEIAVFDTVEDLIEKILGDALV